MQSKFNELKALLLEVSDLQHARDILDWDQMTYMPPGGGIARSRQSALLARLAAERAVNPAIGRLLDELELWAASLPYDSDEAALVRVARRDYERAVRIPPAFVEQMAQNSAEAYEAWVKARPENDFKATLPYLERTLDFSRRLADFFPGYEHIGDPLIEEVDYGMKVTTIRGLFAELHRQLVPIVQTIASQPPADDSFLHYRFPRQKQLDFGLQVIKRFGFDFERGRQDLTHHPFMTMFSLGDVRITTRVAEDFLSDALFSTLHESGHGMYELGNRMELDGTPLAGGTSSGVHESQSRLWENLVGRSHSFWEYFYPRLQKVFPSQLRDVPLERFYAAVNKVERSLIRVDSDEVTYNLHVMIRLDLEMALLEGNLMLRDLPETWHARYQADLGVRAPDNRDGVLQDVHWYAGQIGGMFQGYTLGNILGAQFFAAALAAHPEIPAEMCQGRFATLHSWLVENIYQHGRKLTAAELVQRITGGALSTQPYLDYLKAKYGELYRL